MPLDPITVRLATADDLAALQSRATAPEAQSALRHYERQEAGDYYFALAEQGGTLLGHCVLDCTPGELCPELKSLWVYPEFRRLGAGRALTRHLEGLARERGFVEIFLRVDPENAAAIPMYIGLDYTPTGDHLVVSYPSTDDTGAPVVTERLEAVYRKSLLAH
ncbi:MAG: GNAT family N-acetyltransferase [Propionicimonas sp.]